MATYAGGIKYDITVPQQGAFKTPYICGKLSAEIAIIGKSIDKKSKTEITLIPLKEIQVSQEINKNAKVAFTLNEQVAINLKNCKSVKCIASGLLSGMSYENDFGVGWKFTLSPDPDFCFFSFSKTEKYYEKKISQIKIFKSKLLTWVPKHPSVKQYILYLKKSNPLRKNILFECTVSLKVTFGLTPKGWELVARTIGKRMLPILKQLAIQIGRRLIWPIISTVWKIAVIAATSTAGIITIGVTATFVLSGLVFYATYYCISKAHESGRQIGAASWYCTAFAEAAIIRWGLPEQLDDIETFIGKYEDHSNHSNFWIRFIALTHVEHFVLKLRNGDLLNGSAQLRSMLQFRLRIYGNRVNFTDFNKKYEELWKSHHKKLITAKTQVERNRVVKTQYINRYYRVTKLGTYFTDCIYKALMEIIAAKGSGMYVGTKNMRGVYNPNNKLLRPWYDIEDFPKKLIGL